MEDADGSNSKVREELVKIGVNKTLVDSLSRVEANELLYALIKVRKSCNLDEGGVEGKA